MKIIILGGSGFVGTRLIDELQLIEGIEILNIDKKQSCFFPELTTITDILDKSALYILLKDADIVVLLAAEHRDDVSPKSLYYDVNVGGTKNVLEAMSKNNIKRIIFTSSVAVYGLNKDNPDENHEVDPFNEYGRTKWQAEQALKEWYRKDSSRNVNIVRPTVIFGERNRGNVYNLLRQISTGKFLMIGRGNNKKSMAYVGNIVSLLRYFIEEKPQGYNVYNYVDKPDYTMNELITHISKVLNKFIPTVRIPYFFGLVGGYCFDLLAKISGKKLNISSVRVKKFCATTQFEASAITKEGFEPLYSLGEGLASTLRYEFIEKRDPDTDITFYSE